MQCNNSLYPIMCNICNKCNILEGCNITLPIMCNIPEMALEAVSQNQYYRCYGNYIYVPKGFCNIGGVR